MITGLAVIVIFYVVLLLGAYAACAWLAVLTDGRLPEGVGQTRARKLRWQWTHRWTRARLCWAGVRSRKRLLLITTLLGAALGCCLSLMTQPVYSATVVVDVGHCPHLPFGSRGLCLACTEGKLPPLIRVSRRLDRTANRFGVHNLNLERNLTNLLSKLP